METSTMKNTLKRFLPADELTLKSAQLAEKIVNARWCPDIMVGLWRGGAYPSFVVQEILQRVFNKKIDCVSVWTKSREAETGQQSSTIEVCQDEYVRSQLQIETKLLIVDDVFDSGRTIEAVLAHLQEKLGAHFPVEVQVATVFYKPKRRAVAMVPDFFAEQTDDWLVFPHEMAGLTHAEIAARMAALNKQSFVDLSCPYTDEEVEKAKRWALLYTKQHVDFFGPLTVEEEDFVNKIELVPV